ncbi:MAG: ATP-binding protein, partial [bacterium]|nr:ATP-binding protein [bacterium]
MSGSEQVNAAAGPNPFVGPRPFERGEKLYGRDREVRDLYYLLNAERVVVLHSPSGAGKSSLVQAGLVPRLKEAFDVWGPTRVNQESAAAVNRYVQSALVGFEEDVPEHLRRSPEVLAGQTLAEYFAARPRRRSAPAEAVLLFDQFEEILTAAPLAVAAKEAFFDQLGELLRNPRVWALFILREEYLAPLDPYVRRLPTQLQNRFRIDLLSPEAAKEAMVAP